MEKKTVSRRRLPGAGTVILFLIVMVALIVRGGIFRREAIFVKRQNRVLSEENQRLRAAGRVPGLSARAAGNMKAKGFKDPEQDLLNDLVQHPELIPYDGALGGTMGFYDRENIRIMTDRWVLAPFDDGHRQGYLLLGFQVSDGGKVSWKAIDSYLE